MAWNQPNSITGKKGQQFKKRRSPFWIFASLLIVMGLGFFFLLSPNQDSSAKTIPPVKTKTRPAEKPSAVKKQKKQQQLVETKTPLPVVEERKPTLHDRLAKRKFGVGNRVDTNSVFRTKASYEIFKRRSENHLAFLVNVPYGATVVGGMKYTDRFMKDLEESLKEEIRIEDTDTYEQKLLKASVIEVKEELLKRKNAGEDLREILQDTYREIQKLGVIKQDLEKEVRKLIKDPTLPDSDVEILMQEANKMLEEKGIAPIRYNPLTRRIVREKAFQKINEKESE